MQHIARQAPAQSDPPVPSPRWPAAGRASEIRPDTGRGPPCSVRGRAERFACLRLVAVGLRGGAPVSPYTANNDPVLAVETKLVEHGVLDIVDRPRYYPTLVDQSVAHMTTLASASARRKVRRAPWLSDSRPGPRARRGPLPAICSSSRRAGPVHRADVRAPAARSTARLVQLTQLPGSGVTGPPSRRATARCRCGWRYAWPVALLNIANRTPGQRAAAATPAHGFAVAIAQTVPPADETSFFVTDRRAGERRAVRDRWVPGRGSGAYRRYSRRATSTAKRFSHSSPEPPNTSVMSSTPPTAAVRGASPFCTASSRTSLRSNRRAWWDSRLA